MRNDVKCQQCDAIGDRSGCVNCGEYLGDMLGRIPDIIEELETAMARTGSSWKGGYSGGRSAERGLPYDERAGHALSKLRDIVLAWYQRLGFRCVPSPFLTGGASWAAVCLSRGLETIRWSPYFGELYADVWWALSGAWKVIGREDSAEKVAISQADLWAARDAVLTATEISQALPSFHGKPVTPARVRGLAARGRIQPVGNQPVGHARTVPTYHLGTVMDAMAPDLGVTA